MISEKEIREPVVAGSFYPADKKELESQVIQYIENSKYFGLKDIKAIICPHAGYMYSGQVSGFSYRQVMDKDYDVIVIIAPSHSEYFEHVSIYPGKYFSTPLGLVEIDKGVCASLAEKDHSITFSEYGHGNEHSLEVQLPFVQIALKGIKIVPLVIGKQSRMLLERLGHTLGEVLNNKNPLIIASTDLSHYHPYELAESLDKKVYRLIDDYDLEGLMHDFTSEEIEMCGGGPVIASLLASRIMGAGKAKVLKYLNSGDITGDKSAVVGYLSAATYKG